jgi:hypothetical protein
VTSARPSVPTLLALAAVALTAACDAPSSGANSAPEASTERDYRPAPELLSAADLKGGRLALAGTAAPGAEVRLATPEGAAAFAKADGQGIWRLEIAAAAMPRLFALSMSDHGRIVQAMGYLFVAPGAMARLRAGGGTESLAPARHGLAVLALDYDGKRAATLSGRATPGEALSLHVDGVERAQGLADKTGRFTLSLSEPLGAGSHAFDLASASGEARFSASVDAAAPLAHTPFAAGRAADAWRIDWITPGGGQQTTLVFDQMGPAS